MQEFNLHFYSKTPCNIFIDGEHIGLIDNLKTFFIDVIVLKPTLIVICEPLCENNTTFIPISFKLEFEKQNLKSSLNSTKIIPFPKNNYDILLEFNKLESTQKTDVFNHKSNDVNIMILTNDLSRISVYNNQQNLFSCTQEKLENFDIQTINKITLLTACAANNEKFLLALNTLNNMVLICDCFEKIEQNTNIIKCLKNLHNTVNTGKVFELDLNTKQVNTYNVLLKETQTQVEPNLIPYLFLESVKDENFKYALSFLDDRLCKTKADKFKQFFGEFTDIYYNCYNLKTDFYNYTIVGKTARNFNFYLTGHKISEIEEVNLLNN